MTFLDETVYSKSFLKADETARPFANGKHRASVSSPNPDYLVTEPRHPGNPPNLLPEFASYNFELMRETNEFSVCGMAADSIVKGVQKCLKEDNGAVNASSAIAIVAACAGYACQQVMSFVFFSFATLLLTYAPRQAAWGLLELARTDRSQLTPRELAALDNGPEPGVSVVSHSSGTDFNFGDAINFYAFGSPKSVLLVCARCLGLEEELDTEQEQQSSPQDYLTDLDVLDFADLQRKLVELQSQGLTGVPRIELDGENNEQIMRDAIRARVAKVFL